MIFIETSIFTKEIVKFLTDDEYKLLLWEILLRPKAGDLIRGSSGLRKIRWHTPGSGKRSGLRIIYYFDAPNKIFMLFPYKKNKQEDLTPSQLKILKSLVQEELS